MLRKDPTHAFTLIEFIVVIAIIAILAAILWYRTKAVYKKVRDRKNAGIDPPYVFLLFDRSASNSDAFDHAVAWLNRPTPVGDELYFFYGAYNRGHKAFNDRQLGFARLRLDGYVSRDAMGQVGLLRTPLVTFNAARMSVNAQVNGAMRVRLLDAAGKPLAGFDGADCAPIKGDSTAHRVQWKRPLASLRGKPVQMEFSLRRAQLYGFALVT